MPVFPNVSASGQTVCNLFGLAMRTPSALEIAEVATNLLPKRLGSSSPSMSTSTSTAGVPFLASRTFLAQRIVVEQLKKIGAHLLYATDQRLNNVDLLVDSTTGIQFIRLAELTATKNERTGAQAVVQQVIQLAAQLNQIFVLVDVSNAVAIEYVFFSPVYALLRQHEHASLGSRLSGAVNVDLELL